jgi:hypothetical protein
MCAMRRFNLIVNLLLLCLAGVLIWESPRIVEYVLPAFTWKEANSRVGMRVESLPPPSENVGFSKCPLVKGRCVNTRVGERGTVVRAQAVKPRGYFLVVRWDEVREDGTALYSYLGRYTFRAAVKPAS